MLKIIPYM